MSTLSDGSKHWHGAADSGSGDPPWREVGWIFKDGDALVIERQGDRAGSDRPRVPTHAQEHPSGGLPRFLPLLGGARGVVRPEPPLPA